MVPMPQHFAHLSCVLSRVLALAAVVTVALAGCSGSADPSGSSEPDSKVASGDGGVVDTIRAPQPDGLSWPDPPPPDGAVDQGCDHTWETGSYGACSNTCGAGTRGRTVQCKRCDGTVVDDSLCPQPVPAREESCNDESGCTYSYGPWSGWSACDASKQRTRTRECKRSDGASAACSECGGVCSESQSCCQNTNIVNGNGKAACDQSIAQAKSTCLANGCTWGGPEVCTLGGSPSSSTAYGAVVTCY